MELHTLGVDGGYTQQDVIEVARALTGWTMNPRQTGEFVFRPEMHDAGAEGGARPHARRRAAASRTARTCSTSSRGIRSTARFIATQAGACAS